MPDDNPPFAELFWGAYLTALHESRAITPSADITKIKADFMSGLRGEAPTLGPDCHDGKHRACDGRALDEATDEITTCDCTCHKEEP